MNDPKNERAVGLDRLTGTFTSDRRFCSSLADANAAELARILIYVRWARHYIPSIQLEMESLVQRHFDSAHSKKAGYWTATLLGATGKDLGIMGYLVVRGLIWDAGLAARRSLENVGALAALWLKPEKASSLGSPEDEDFRRAFVWESDKATRAELKTRGIQKRFEACGMAAGISQLYSLLSKYSVHGGSPDALASAEVEPTRHSCMFVNRPDPSRKDLSAEVTVIGNACEMLVVEIAQVLGSVRNRYELPPSTASEGGFLVSQLIDSGSGQMAALVKETIGQLGWRQSQNVF